MLHQIKSERCWLLLVVLSTVMRASFVSSQAMCPIIEDRYAHTRLKSHDPNGPDFKEVSGLAISPTQTHNGRPIFFAISDGGGDSRIGIFDSEDGRRLRTLRVDRGFFRNADWESLTIGSCGKSGEGDTCLYVMDAGDNQARQNNGNRGRGDYRILKIREPRWTDYNDNDYISKNRMSRMDFDYRHHSSPTNYADCEAMFVDHKGWGSGESKGDIYLATKWDKGNEISKNRLFQLPASAWSSGYDGAVHRYSVKSVGNYDYNRYQQNGGIHFMKTTWSSAEMSFDGTMIALGNLQKSYVFLRCPGTSVADAIANPHANAKPCVEWSHPATGQVETLAWTPDRRYTLDIPEGDSPKMGWTKLRFDRNRSSKVCPGPPPPPTRPPTRRPTPQPTRNPTPRPTPRPTPNPTGLPSISPTKAPTTTPSLSPTRLPSISPSEVPSLTPSMSPSLSSSPTSCDGHIFELILQTDDQAATTQWKVYNGVEELVGEGGGYSNRATIFYSQCLEPGLHSFEISNEMVDGVPGLYQIWYDKILMYDSQGQSGSYKEIFFAYEFDDQSWVPKTPTPTQAPTLTTENEIFGVSCGGICPGSFSQVANAQQVVSLGRNAGTEYFCGSLDKRYQQLFSTPDACEALQVSAQRAGCECEVVGQVTNSATAGQQASREAENESQSLEIQWGLILGIIAAVCCLGTCCFKYTGRRRNSEESDNLKGDANEKARDVESVDETGRISISDDSTTNSASDESGEMSDINDKSLPLPLQRVKSAFAVVQNHGHQLLPLRRVKTAMDSSVVHENDGQRLLPVRRVQSSMEHRFVQSWQLAMPEGNTEHSEEGFEVCSDDQCAKGKMLDLNSPSSVDDSLESLELPKFDRSFESNRSNCSDESATIMSA